MHLGYYLKATNADTCYLTFEYSLFAEIANSLPQHFQLQNRACAGIEHYQVMWLYDIETGFKSKYRQKSGTGSHGLVGYDTALTRLGPRVQFPLAVMFYIPLIF
ncbi:hypothetical protein FGO68_gene12757 [Halteria grandinella]|uniref:Uncharacterized protein n=1 Tax=Halteria grandinella TaxID=5974 RepID=A0A8J8NMC2_HALGN|nr:hypothetical protein FGO68_gene12757 [Halteria grandinella]